MDSSRLRGAFGGHLGVLLLGLAIGSILVVATLAAGPVWDRTPSSTGGSASNCEATDTQVADPGATHGLFVLDPSTAPGGAYFGDIASYLLTNPAVCGADLWVHWNTIDQGPGAEPQYNFTKVDAEITPWVAAGKVVNLIFWSVGYGANSTFVPPYVLANISTIQCGGSAVTPLFWQTSFVHPYQAFLRAAIQHYGHVPGVGYLRFGLGTGGEVFPLSDVTQPGCEAKLNHTGFTDAVWEQYVLSMMEFEHAQNSSVPLFVGLNNIIPGTPDNLSTMISAAAAEYGFGIGSQGLQASAVQSDPLSGDATCNGGWCKSFARYQGQIPLELQTLGPTEPNGSGPLGPLGPLLTYGMAEHAQVFELYFDDWLTGFDPNYPAYAAYHAGYADAFDQAASVVD